MKSVGSGERYVSHSSTTFSGVSLSKPPQQHLSRSKLLSPGSINAWVSPLLPPQRQPNEEDRFVGDVPHVHIAAELVFTDHVGNRPPFSFTEQLVA